MRLVQDLSAIRLNEVISNPGYILPFNPIVKIL